MFLHSEGHLERYTELHGEEKRAEGDRVDQEEKRGIKRGESKLASNQFPVCSPQSGLLRDVHGVSQRREREEGDRGGQEDKGGNQKERDRSSQQSVP